MSEEVQAPTSALDTAGVEDSTVEADASFQTGPVPSSAEPIADPMDEILKGEGTEAEEGDGVEVATQEKGAQDGDVEVEKDATADEPESSDNFDYSKLSAPGMSDDDARLENFKEVAKAANLTLEQAQAFINEDMKRVEVRESQQRDALEARNKQWQDETKSDSEVGGVNFEDNLHDARKWIKAYGDESLVDMLNQSGLGNHPSFVRLFVRLAKAGGEDSTFVMSQPGRRERTLDERLVPELANL